ncbi:MAG: hypothetical protein J0J03_00345 [Leifsonia sp.]|nr:hypothetical protein [Leifsonia sp.]
MTQGSTPNRRPRLWLALGAVLALVGIAVLWPLQHVGQVCVLIYPAPPGCGAAEPRWAPLVGIGLVIALLAAQVVVYATAARPRTPLILLSAGIVVVVALAAAVVALSQTGIWDPYQPPVIID